MPSQLPPQFHHQATSGPDAGLCAFFASRHFLGTLPKPTFDEAAIGIYTAIGMSRADAAAMASDGNDPAVVDTLLSGQATGQATLQPGDWLGGTRILVALKNRAHFITVLRGPDGKWMNYDSLQAKPTPIQNIDSFLQTNPGQRYWVGKA